MRPTMPSLLAVVLMATAHEAAAQAWPEPPPLRLPAGVRARVFTRALPDRTIEGTIVSADASAVTLVPKWADPLERPEMTVSTSDVMKLGELREEAALRQGALIGRRRVLLGLATSIPSGVRSTRTSVQPRRGHRQEAGRRTSAAPSGSSSRRNAGHRSARYAGPPPRPGERSPPSLSSHRPVLSLSCRV
jgi:hypothetical protein